MGHVLAAFFVGSSLVLSGPALAQERVDCKGLDQQVEIYLKEVRPNLENFKPIDIPILTAMVGEGAKGCLPRPLYIPDFGTFKVTEGPDYHTMDYKWYNIEKID